MQDIDAYNMHYYYSKYSYSPGYVRYMNENPTKNRRKMFVEAYGNGNYSVGISKLRNRANYLLTNNGHVNGMKRPYDPTELERKVFVDMFIEELMK